MDGSSEFSASDKATRGKRKKAQVLVSRHGRFSVAISTSCSVCACCSRSSPGSCHLQTSPLRLCILALRSDAPIQCVRQFGGVRKSFTHGEKKRRATGLHRACNNIVFFLGYKVAGSVFQELVVGFQVPLLMPMRYRGARGGGRWWRVGGRQGGDTCPHQPANAKHVSSPPSAPPGENGRDLLHF